MPFLFYAFPSFAPLPALRPGEAHLYTARLDRARAALPTLLPVLSRPERDKARAYRFQEDRDRYVVARGLLRRLLGRVLQRDPGDVPLCADANGKPRLRARQGRTPAIGFNVSHSGNIVLVALARDREVGVDVEHMRPLPDLDRLAALCFSPREREQYRALASESRLEAFYACWTCKEALLKATGEGLGRDPRSLDIGFAGADRPGILPVPETGATLPEGCRLRTFVPAPGYAGACVLCPWP